MLIQEVPNPIDLKNPQDALTWAQEANKKRPWRYEFFDYYVNIIQQLKLSQSETEQPHVLELGSGPGFLAKHILNLNSEMLYTAIDFSEAMHELSKSKLLSSELERTTYLIADFKNTEWTSSLGKYDVVIIHQALHELRHKSYATCFHQKVKTLLKPRAVYLVCDHIYAPDAMNNNELYMSKHEHFQALKNAGFDDVSLVKETKGLCLFENYV